MHLLQIQLHSADAIDPLTRIGPPVRAFVPWVSPHGYLIHPPSAVCARSFRGFHRTAIPDSSLFGGVRAFVPWVSPHGYLIHPPSGCARARSVGFTARLPDSSPFGGVRAFVPWVSPHGYLIHPPSGVRVRSVGFTARLPDSSPFGVGARSFRGFHRTAT